ncbi:hypothetical protein SOCE26_013280 [Sorangium cellulosum]|uniref:Uncharacterized protein n=1 Tax=Sorangium cellulosum TaxID=56 RepID=A0A2L0EKW1_SORCE|nr:hypothetical protein [Sorangium cellulosum]AUX39933.1 hypothetical protein SOCE26_013280 [Sorangium cellulosum]
MNAKRSLLLIVAIAIWTLAACNWTVGDCYPREEWEEGAGAGGPVGPPVPVFTSAGSGDFGAEPPDDGERKIQCNKTEDDDEEESPNDSSERPRDSPTSPPDPCQQSGAPSMGCTGKIPIDPRAFNFATIVAYDGIGVAGGWQETKAYLAFGHDGEGDSTCMVHIGMPLRSEEWGTISSDRAAQISADVANWSADIVYEKDRGAQLPPGIFCNRFKSRMVERFASGLYKGLGARVQNP